MKSLNDPKFVCKSIAEEMLRQLYGKMNSSIVSNIDVPVWGEIHKRIFSSIIRKIRWYDMLNNDSKNH